jgi:hypothetical protein
VIRRLFVLAVVLLVVNAAVHAGLVWLRYQDFKDAIREAALYAGTSSDDALKERVMQIARDKNVPLNADDLTIDRSGSITITATYVDVIELAPGYRRPWNFQVVGR